MASRTGLSGKVPKMANNITGEFYSIGMLQNGNMLLNYGNHMVTYAPNNNMEVKELTAPDRDIEGNKVTQNQQYLLRFEATGSGAPKLITASPIGKSNSFLVSAVSDFEFVKRLVAKYEALGLEFDKSKLNDEFINSAPENAIIFAGKDMEVARFVCDTYSGGKMQPNILPYYLLAEDDERIYTALNSIQFTINESIADKAVSVLKDTTGDDYYLTAQHIDFAKMASNFMEQGGDRMLGCIIRGHTGSGKTEYGYVLGQYLGVPVVKVDGLTCREVDELFINTRYEVVREGGEPELVRELNHFAHALMSPEPCVIILDELSRWHVGNGLLPILDGFKSINVLGQEIKAVGTKVILATANIGSEYVGVMGLDDAVANRFVFNLRFDEYDVVVEEKIIGNAVKISGINAKSQSKYTRVIAQVVAATRKIAEQNRWTGDELLSTRKLKSILNIWQGLSSLSKGFEYGYARSFPQAQYQQIMSVVSGILAKEGIE